jgi:hypothetical protein
MWVRGCCKSLTNVKGARLGIELPQNVDFGSLPSEKEFLKSFFEVYESQ